MRNHRIIDHACGTCGLPCARSTRLAKAIALLFGLSPLVASAEIATAAPASSNANTWTITTCLDDGALGNVAQRTGSLRFVAAHAISGDTIDMTQLTCSVISLQHGAIALQQDDMTLQGPGVDQLYITGKYEHDRIFTHTGSGELRLSGMTIQQGYVLMTTSARGGCIYAGDLSLDHVEVSHCSARATAGHAYGGGLVAKGRLTLTSSKLLGNSVYGGPSGIGFGGGAESRGLDVNYSEIADNIAGGAGGEGGGLLSLSGDVAVSNSAIAGNKVNQTTTLDTKGGGLYLKGDSIVISNTTISGNAFTDTGSGTAGGLSAVADTIVLESTTVVENSAGTVQGAEFVSGTLITLHNTLIANNRNPAFGELDLETCDLCAAIGGSGNLVRFTTAQVPSDTIQGQCPFLGPLTDNGGVTRTHALMSGSPAIDHGDAAGVPAYDQRGAPYVRTSGASPDSGSYEVDRSDVIFNNAFEGCP